MKCLITSLNDIKLYLQEDVKESLLIKDQLYENKEKIKKMRYKRKALLKHQEELQEKRDELSDEVKDLEARIAAGRRGEEVEVDASFPDLLMGEDDSGIDVFLSSTSGQHMLSSSADEMLTNDFDLSLFEEFVANDDTAN